MTEITKPKMGRPRKEFDPEQFEKLCSIQCTIEEICAYFDMDHETLNERIKEEYNGKTFSTIFATKRKTGHVSLRRSQFQKALEGDNTMLVWLGKNYLGQRDKFEDDTSKSTDNTDALLLAKLVDMLKTNKSE